MKNWSRQTLSDSRGKKKVHIEGGETNRICLSASQQLLRGSPVVWKEVQLHDEMKHAFITTESNIMFSPTAYVESLRLMYTQYSTVLHAFCVHMYIHRADRSKLGCRDTNSWGDRAHGTWLYMHECTPGYTSAQYMHKIKIKLSGWSKYQRLIQWWFSVNRWCEQKVLFPVNSAVFKGLRQARTTFYWAAWQTTKMFQYCQSTESPSKDSIWCQIVWWLDYWQAE